MQTIHIQIGDQIHVIYCARDYSYDLSMTPEGKHRHFKNVRQFWRHAESVVVSRSPKKDVAPCIIKKLAREMVKHMSKPVEETERQEWLARFERDNAAAGQQAPVYTQPKQGVCGGEACTVVDCDNFHCRNYIPF